LRGARVHMDILVKQALAMRDVTGDITGYVMDNLS
jgi:hypothetical protein